VTQGEAMKKKERVCFVCRTKKPVCQLIRVARVDGKYIIDEAGNANGRGCHIAPECIEKAIKTRALNRSFKANVDEEIYILLANYAKKV
jgi:predicted RNA-binding protein YlxR (DUF448 family)